MRTILFVLLIFLILRYAWRLLGAANSGQDRQTKENPNIRVDKAPDDQKRYDDAEYVDYEEVE